jgi:hypothetical protein
VTAGIWNLTIEAGTDFDATITVADDGVIRDLTDYDPRMQIRDQQGNLVLELNLANGRFAIPTPANGEIVVFIAGDDTVGISKICRHDLELTAPDDSVKRLLRGTAVFSRDITEDAVP